jgi:hypothetical protein
MTAELRSVMTGLLSLACVEEQALLAACASGQDSADPGDRGGSPETWAAVPLVAHNNEFKSQQAERIVAIRSGQVPPAFGEVDHESAELYQRYSAQSADEVMVGCRTGRGSPLRLTLASFGTPRAGRRLSCQS